MTKSTQPLAFSIVIPVYNEGAYLTKCLDAIAAQTIMPEEVIVVDNNSSDNSAEIAASYPFVTLVREAQQGVLFARDAGFAAATGTVICRIDADTVLEPNWIETVHAFYAKHPDVAAVTGDCLFYDFPFKRLFQFVHHVGYYDIQKLVAGTEILWGSNMAITKQAWDAVQPDCLRRKDVHEDIDLSIHLHDNGYEIRRYKPLRAHVSLRRGNLGPMDIVRYLQPWPQTYFANKRVVQGVLISLLLGGMLALVLPAAALRSLGLKLGIKPFPTAS